MADWSVGVLGKDGKIYCIPDTATEVLRYDPVTRETSRFGEGEISVGIHKWSGGVLAGDGKIYGVPWTHPQVLVIDPSESSVSFLDTITDEGTKAASLAEHKWRDAVLVPDGRIFCVPWTAEAVLVIDPKTSSATCFGKLPEGESKWAGAVLADDGHIYCAPYDARSLLCISVVEQKLVCLGDFGPARRKWRGAILAGEQRVFMVPSNALEVLVIHLEEVAQSVQEAFAKLDGGAEAVEQAAIESAKAAAKEAAKLAVADVDESDDADGGAEAEEDESKKAGGVRGMELFGWVGGIRCKWRGGVVAEDGCIYCIPDCSTEVLRIDPREKEVKTFARCGMAKWKWKGGVLAPDGKIYCAPYETHEQILVINPAKRSVDALPAFDGGGLKLPGFVEAEGTVLAVPLC
eukprot:TRINITY_DN7988_c0_g1_i5.p1 TRINITY_DN7988_c0_g1~~TRINITY_DN7988_c0_g1_i5.p1  ORF type:complete len:405 (+),score=97.06 TRINITY_DN7988_c0_g1_i5:138-1352(+)